LFGFVSLFPLFYELFINMYALFVIH
jgi:hypothetical protein